MFTAGGRRLLPPVQLGGRPAFLAADAGWRLLAVAAGGAFWVWDLAALRVEVQGSAAPLLSLAPARGSLIRLLHCNACIVQSLIQRRCRALRRRCWRSRPREVRMWSCENKCPIPHVRTSASEMQDAALAWQHARSDADCAITCSWPSGTDVLTNFDAMRMPHRLTQEMRPRLARVIHAAVPRTGN